MTWAREPHPNWHFFSWNGFFIRVKSCLVSDNEIIKESNIFNQKPSTKSCYSIIISLKYLLANFFLQGWQFKSFLIILWSVDRDKFLRVDKPSCSSICWWINWIFSGVLFVTSLPEFTLFLFNPLLHEVFFLCFSWHILR